MAKTVKALKTLYAAFGGTPADVANLSRTVDVLNAFSAMHEGASDAKTIPVAIANIAAVASDIVGIKPTGSINCTENKTYDVTNYASAVVNVPTGGGGDN